MTRVIVLAGELQVGYDVVQLSGRVSRVHAIVDLGHLAGLARDKRFVRVSFRNRRDHVWIEDAPVWIELPVSMAKAEMLEIVETL